MKIINTNNINASQLDIIFKLWNEEYPASIVYHSISQLDEYLNKLSDVNHYFLLNKGQTIGWASSFIRDTEKWFAIIIDRAFQGRGLGKFLLNHLKEDESVLNGWIMEDDRYLKADGSAYRSPAAFYLKNDFEIIDNIHLDIPQMKAVKIYWKKG